MPLERALEKPLRGLADEVGTAEQETSAWRVLEEALQRLGAGQDGVVEDATAALMLRRPSEWPSDLLTRLLVSTRPAGHPPHTAV